jgi:hypothetical protein
MITKHPHEDGWCIVVGRVAELVDGTAEPEIDIATGQEIDQWLFVEPDFLDGDIEPTRAWAVDTVNAECGRLRAQIGTDIAFQDSLYEQKRQELAGYVAILPDQAAPLGWSSAAVPGYLNDPAPDADKYPALYQEAAARSLTTDALAAEWAANAYAWPRLIAALEVRLQAIEQIRAATTVAEIETALAGLTWPELP